MKGRFGMGLQDVGEGCFINKADLRLFNGLSSGHVGFIGKKAPITHDIARARKADDLLMSLGIHFEYLHLSGANAIESVGIIAIIENNLSWTVFIGDLGGIDLA